MQTIRLATIADLPRCAELLGVLFGQEREFTPDPIVQGRGLEMILHDPGAGAVFVYEEGGIVQGMVVLLFSISTALGKRVAILEDMIVSPDLRGRGVGTRLVRAAVAFAETNGFGRITLLTDFDNEGAHDFYSRNGFTRSDMVVFRKLLSA